MPAYKPAFPIGSSIRIANRATLERFRLEWRLHHRLQPEQLAHADEIRTVVNVGHYHGGDVLYTLSDLPDYLWHEQCLIGMG